MVRLGVGLNFNTKCGQRISALEYYLHRRENRRGRREKTIFWSVIKSLTDFICLRKDILFRVTMWVVVQFGKMIGCHLTVRTFHSDIVYLVPGSGKTRRTRSLETAAVSDESNYFQCISYQQHLGPQENWKGRHNWLKELPLPWPFRHVESFLRFHNS